MDNDDSSSGSDLGLRHRFALLFCTPQVKL